MGSVALCSPDANKRTQMLAVGGLHTIRMIDVRTGALCRQEQRPGRVRTVALSSDGVMLDGGFDQQVKLAGCS